MSIVKLNNRGVRNVSAFGSITTLGEMRFIKKQTISTVATVNFVNGSSDVVLDNSYKQYLFTLNNIHPSSQGDILKVNFSDDTSSHSYDLSKTTSNFYARHDEDGTDGGTSVASNLGNSTSDQEIVVNINADSDSSCSGYLHLFNPSSTVFAKHFISRMNSDGESARCFTSFTGGYINTTNAVTAVRFTTGGSNIDSGIICLYGIN